MPIIPPHKNPNWKHHTGKIAIEYDPDSASRMKKRGDRRNTLFNRAHELATICGGTVFCRYVDENNKSFVFTNKDELWNEYASIGLQSHPDLLKNKRMPAPHFEKDSSSCSNCATISAPSREVKELQEAVAQMVSTVMIENADGTIWQPTPGCKNESQPAEHGETSNKRRHSSSAHEDDDSPRKKSRKHKKHKHKSKGKKKKKRYYSSSSDSSSESSSSSSSESDSQSDDSSSDTDSEVERHRRKKEKRKKKKEKKRKHKKSKKLKKLVEKEKKRQSIDKSGTELSNNVIGPSYSVSAEQNQGSSSSQTKRPMTKEQWDKQQSVLKHVFDPETGRTRLIRGDGEIVEEMVSKQQHSQINKQATMGDGLFYAKQAGLL